MHTAPDITSSHLLTQLLLGMVLEHKVLLLSLSHASKHQRDKLTDL